MSEKNKILSVLDSLNSMCNQLKDIEQSYEELINKMDNRESYLDSLNENKEELKPKAEN